MHQWNLICSGVSTRRHWLKLCPKGIWSSCSVHESLHVMFHWLVRHLSDHLQQRTTITTALLMVSLSSYLKSTAYSLSFLSFSLDMIIQSVYHYFKNTKTKWNYLYSLSSFQSFKMQEMTAFYGPVSQSYWLMQIYLEDNFIHGVRKWKLSRCSG